MMQRLQALVLAGSLGLASCGPGAMPPSFRHVLSGSHAPGLAQIVGEQGQVGIPQGAPVKVTVVDFWASWCAGCQESIPALDALYRDKREAGLRVFGVSVDERSDQAYAAAAALHATFPIVVDLDSRLASSYRIAQIPLTFVLDSQGTVRWVGRDPREVRRAVEVVLAE